MVRMTLCSYTTLTDVAQTCCARPGERTCLGHRVIGFERIVSGPTRGDATVEDVGDERDAGEVLAADDVLVARGGEEVQPVRIIARARPMTVPRLPLRITPMSTLQHG
jgi:hypothetical protein